MRKNILLFPILFFSSFGFSQKNSANEEVTRIIIVRHAEKNDDGTKNPSLSEAGKARAERLSKMLGEFPIGALFSTPYARTTETLQQLAASRKLEITNYNPGDKSFASNLVHSQKGKTIVITGHSNTCPALVNSLINETKYKDLDESDYGKIWIVTYKNEKLTDCIVLNY
jgi:2,3-bisphosphoglycerate-dependent phosphoglycerate mutase